MAESISDPTEGGIHLRTSGRLLLPTTVTTTTTTTTVLELILIVSTPGPSCFALVACDTPPL